MLRRSSLCRVFSGLHAACVFLLTAGVSPSQAQFDAPRVSAIINPRDSGNLPDGLRKRRYYIDAGLETNIQRGDVLNVYREKRVNRNVTRPFRMLIGRMTITDSQPGTSVGSFEASASTISHPLIRFKTAMKGDIVMPRIVLDAAILFQPGKATLAKAAQPEFKKIAVFVQNFSPSKIVIEGHTDSDGDPKSNQLLSETRARIVKQFLVARYEFIKPSMVESLGYGAQRPIAPNDSPLNKQLNRRIEVIVWD